MRGLPAAIAAALIVGIPFITLDARGADFVRGDANRDGKVNVSDAVAELLAFFGGAFGLTCEDAADSNDDGKLDVTDAITILSDLFGAGATITYPRAVSGPDPTCDSLGCEGGPATPPAIVLSEVHYNLRDSRDEFVELHNRTEIEIDVSGYKFTDGIAVEIPQGTVIPPQGYLLVVKDPERGRWSRASAPIVGPFEGTLSDNGETLEYTAGDCAGEAVTYDDRPPWPIAADGFNDGPAGRPFGRAEYPSLERVDFIAPADDDHSWRASLADEGTPGKANSTLGTPTRPTIRSAAISPEHPGAEDIVDVTLKIDFDEDVPIRRVSVRWETLTEVLTPGDSIEMTLASTDGDLATFIAQLPEGPSQAIRRYNVEVELADDTAVVLPNISEPAPLLSYFIYDDEVAAKLPILWMFRVKTSTVSDLVPGRLGTSAVVIKEVGESHPVLYDGALVRGSNQGMKFKFLKGAEHRGDRTLNMLPERGGDEVVGGVGGPYAPQLEHFGYQTYRDLGGLAQEPRWFRVLELGGTAPHTQRVLFQQINEKLFEKEELDPRGDLYKNSHTNWEKRNNFETGNASILELVAAVTDPDPAVVRAAVLERYDLDSWLRHSAVSVLISHGDNYGNNFWVHQEPDTGRWMVLPWDLDTTMQNPASVGSPYGGILHGPFHAQPEIDKTYREFLRAQIAAGGAFSVEAVGVKTQTLQDLLLEDLALQEAYMGIERTERRELIIGAYKFIREFAAKNISALRAQLGP